jgi:hypothetical protein
MRRCPRLVSSGFVLFRLGLTCFVFFVWFRLGKSFVYVGWGGLSAVVGVCDV